ncbi:MAG: hypothetical protein M3O72_04150 [Verrucomicrobiota bacterium]|nr:hypothetical protein [Verrucomicrobiota bacterium]
MKALTFTSLVWIALAATVFGRIGEDEKQIESRYGKPGKDLGNHGEVHQIGYISNGFMILVGFVNGVSQREGFANPDTSALTPEAVERILIMSAVEGTKWQETNAPGGDRSWKRSDNKVVASFPRRESFCLSRILTSLSRRSSGEEEDLLETLK